jgi:hypothetical protein
LITSRQQMYEHYGIDSDDSQRYELIVEKMQLPPNSVAIAGDNNVIFHVFDDQRLCMSLRLHYPFSVDMLLHILSVVTYFEQDIPAPRSSA